MSVAGVEGGGVEAEVARLEAEIAEVCGVLNAATGRLVALVGRVLATGAWEGAGLRSAEQWVAWRCGVSGSRARQLVAMARRLPELPATRAALEAGELAPDQAAAICRHAPAHAEAAVATLARAATVSQLRRVLADYSWGPDASPDPPGDERRPVRFGHRDDGSWSLSARLAPDEGAVVERALEAARRALVAEAGPGGPDPAWADALVAMADRSLGGSPRPRHARHTVLVHVRTDASGTAGHLHLGPGLPDCLRRYLGCDAGARAVVEADATVVSVGRSMRIVPARTRIAVEDRDRGCRLPGCDRTRGLEVHHVRSWEDGGATDTPNLVALCARHHRQHHLGGFRIDGHDADDADGLVFVDHRGRTLTSRGRPTPPDPTGDPPAPGAWVHPTGERLQSKWVWFPDRPASPP